MAKKGLDAYEKSQENVSQGGQQAQTQQPQGTYDSQGSGTYCRRCAAMRS